VRERWRATLYRVADAAPEQVAWTVDKDARGGIVASAWRTPAPRLVDGGDHDDRARTSPPLSTMVLAALVDEG